VTILIVIIIIYSILAYTKVKNLKENVSVLFLVIGICLAITMYMTIAYETFPESNLTTMISPNRDFTVSLSRDSTLWIPIRNIINSVTSNLIVEISHNVDGLKILPLKLSTTSDSPLSYRNANFRNNPSSIVIDNKTFNVDNYTLPVTARHTGEVSNKSYTYAVDITYFNNTGARNQVNIPLSWAIKTTDLNTLSYFWIVLIGVLVSRALHLALNKLAAQGTPPKGMTLKTSPP
jgi:hypothetical protein